MYICVYVSLFACVLVSQHHKTDYSPPQYLGLVDDLEGHLLPRHHVPRLLHPVKSVEG